MHVFVVLSVLLVVACAAPQYGYQQPDSFSAGPTNSYSGLSPVGLQQHSGHRRGGEKYLPPGATTVSPLVRKQFYVVSAPEDEDNTPKTKHLVLGRPQRNYRVVFIKAPNSNAGNVKYSAEFAPQEEKTVIYVLSKKDNELDASDIATPAPTPAGKPEVFFIKYKTDEEAQKAQKEIQDGWQAFRDSVRLQFWEYRKALVHLQAAYGIFPYYKVAVENRFNKPHDYIITLDEGEIGLPDKYFYNRDQNDAIVRAYILLLRDFAINMGIVSGEAELFADEVFHYEKRIVNHINLVRTSSSERTLNEIKTLAEIKTIAPSLPILETLQALFPHTKITEETEVLVKDVEFFHQISTVVATSDKKPINNFIVWSLARHLLPHLSREYRNLVETFDHAVYGRTATYPRWMICSKIVKQWLPFAVDSLQQRKELEKAFTYVFKHSRESLLNKTTGNDEFLKLIYYTVRNQLQQSVDEADWIDRDLKHFINEKLTTMRLQIGIPEEVLTNKSYIKDFYNELLLNNLFFVDHLQSIWSFRKSRMEEKLKALNIIDTIISEMYADDKSPSVAYSNMLNMLVISRGIAASKYYDYRYPIAVNFARIGTDILEVLIDSISTFVEQFKADNNDALGVNLNMALVDVDCITANEQDADDLKELSESALKSFHITLSAAKITAKALSSFINAIDSSSPIIGASFDQEHTYESLRLTERLRLPGLRSFNENELFTLAYMQKHCSTKIADKDDYARIKPHIEQQLAERYLFNATWNHIQFLPLSTSCSVPSVRCSNIL